MVTVGDLRRFEEHCKDEIREVGEALTAKDGTRIIATAAQLLITGGTHSAALGVTAKVLAHQFGKWFQDTPDRRVEALKVEWAQEDTRKASRQELIAEIYQLVQTGQTYIEESLRVLARNQEGGLVRADEVAARLDEHFFKTHWSLEDIGHGVATSGKLVEQISRDLQERAGELRFCKQLTLRPKQAARHAPTDSEATIAQRREALGSAASWRRLKDECYFERPTLLFQVRAQFDRWRSLPSGNKIPVFWLDGRSGDGKSVLLLQLVADELRRQPDSLCFLPNSLNDLPSAIRELSRQQGPTFLVVDDLHRALTDEELKIRLEELLEEELPPVRVLACGPTPERDDFVKETESVCSVQPYTVRGPSHAEREGFARWLGKDAAKEQQPGELLVEFLFELQVGEPLNAFAANFKRRLQEINSELLGRVTTVVALNGLDLPADRAILGTDRGRDFVERLQADDQRHFDLTRTFGNHDPAVWFSHTRIAWRLFDIWTADARVARPLSRRLGEALARGLSLYTSRPKDIANAVDKIALRLSQLSGAGEKSSVVQVVEDLAERLHGQPLLLVVLRLLQLRASGRAPPIPNSLLKCGLELCKHPESPMVSRGNLLSHLLVICANEKSPRLREAEELAESLLFVAENREQGGAHVVYVASKAEAADAKGWTSWPRRFIDLHPESPGTSVALTWQLSFRHDQTAVAPALHWLRAHPTLQGRQGVLVALLELPQVPQQVVDEVTDWLAHESPDAQGVVVALLASLGARPEVLAAIFRWLPSHGSEPRSWKVVRALLNATPLPEVCVMGVLTWLADDGASPGSAKVVIALLEKVGARDDVVRASLSWVRKQPGADGAHEVLVWLLRKTKLQPKVVACALAWLDASTGCLAASHLIEFMLSAAELLPEVLPRARAWLDATGFNAQGAQVLRAMLVSCGPGEEIVSHAFSWLDKNPAGAGGAILIESLLHSAEHKERIIPRALAWLERCDRTDKPHQVLIKLITASVDDAELHETIVATGLAWLSSSESWDSRQHLAVALLEKSRLTSVVVAGVLPLLRSAPPQAAKSRSVALVLRALVRVAADDVAVIAVATEWWDAHAGQPGSAALLAALLIGTNAQDAMTARADRWLADPSNAKERLLVEKGVLEALVAAQPLLPELPHRVRAFLDCEKSDQHRAIVLGRWLNAGGASGPAVDVILDVHRNGAIHSKYRSQTALARACARNVEVSLEAAALRSQDARDLYYLISRGTHQVEGSAARLWALRERWLPQHVGYLWYGLLVDPKLATDAYLLDLLLWLKGEGHSRKAVVQAMMVRCEREPQLASKLPARLLQQFKDV